MPHPHRPREIPVTCPDPPWNLIQWGGAIVLTAGVFICYPFSKTIWLAIDLMFRPPALDDLSADGPMATRGPATSHRYDKTK